MSNFKPMLAASTIPAIEDLDYPVIASPKLDGIRCLVIDGVAYSRNLKLIPNRHVRDTLAALEIDKLDGELMIDGDFNSVQSAIMSEGGKPNFYFNVFDDFEFLDRPFSTRLISAKGKVRDIDSSYVRAVNQVWIDSPEDMTWYLEHWISEGYEGAIVRQPKSVYKKGRSTLKQGWMLKLKKFDDDEAEIIGFEELMHNENPAEIGELGQTKHSHEKAGLVPGGTLGAFICKWKGVEFNLGTGFTAAQRQAYFLDKSIEGSLAKFKYQGVGPNGKPRFPVFLGFRHKDDL
jgi:DNA ligase 1